MAQLFPVAFADKNVDDQTNLIKSIDYYVNLLPFQYKGLPNATALMEIFVKQALGDMMVAQVQQAFTLDTAYGAQLDVLGKYIGLSRIIEEPAPFLYFGFVNTPAGLNDNDNGFRQPADPTINPADLFFRGQQSVYTSVTMTDEQYRLMLKIKVQQNMSNETMPDIIERLFNVWPSGGGDTFNVVDNHNMGLTYYLNIFNPFSDIPTAQLQLARVLPRPMGVGITVYLNEPDLSRIIEGPGTAAQNQRITQDSNTRVIIG